MSWFCKYLKKEISDPRSCGTDASCDCTPELAARTKVTAATPDNTPARKQRVSDADRLSLRENATAAKSRWDYRFPDAQVMLRLLDDIAAQAERIATLERERDEARKLKVAWFEAAQSFADRATIAEARITDLTRQLAEAERAGMERAAGIAETLEHPTSVWRQDRTPARNTAFAIAAAIRSAIGCRRPSKL